VLKTRYLVGGGAVAAVALAFGLVAAYSAEGFAGPDDPHAVSFAVVGDSITAWAGKESGSWTSYAGADGVHFSGQGWARNGAPLALMEANTPALHEDVLVVLAGTNDLRSAVPFEERLDILDSIVEKSRMDRVLVASVPPYDPEPGLATEWNAALREHADDAGYAFVDPWEGVRTGAARYAADTTPDGVHPTPDAARQAGERMRDAILEAGD